MNRKTLLRAALLTPLALIGVLTVSQGLGTQDEGMEAVGEQPTAEHNYLAKLEGEWDASLKMWMMPGADAMMMTGSESVEMLGSFWAIATFEGEFMGMAFSGIGTTGYDPKGKTYIGTWIDSTSSFMSRMEGSMNENEEMVFHYEAPDMTGQMAKNKSVGKFIDDNKRMYTSYTIDAEGKEHMMMEITYTRKK